MKRKILTLLIAAFVLSLPMQALADSGVITGDMVNLRSQATIYSARQAYLNRGDQVEVTGSSGDWYKVNYKTLSGYVHQDYVSVTLTGAGLLRYGSRGTEVKTLQTQLISLGYLSDRADGIFGAKTQAAVQRYQFRNGLSVDGIAGPATRSAVSKEYSRIQSIMTLAKKYLGLPYIYGGSTPDGFDCSGFTQYVYQNAAGISIPRVSYEQAAYGTAVPYSQMRPGDLVAFNSPVNHVGIYLGDGKFIHSPKPGDVVKITELKYMNLTAIRRFTGKLAY